MTYSANVEALTGTEVFAFARPGAISLINQVHGANKHLHYDSPHGRFLSRPNQSLSQVIILLWDKGISELGSVVAQEDCACGELFDKDTL